MQEIEPNRDNSQPFAELWSSLTSVQQRFAIARLHTSTDVEAAQEAQVNAGTLRHWPNKRDVDKCIGMMIANARDSAMGILEAGLIKAATVKLAGLDVGEGKGQIAQEAASEIMDRLLGKPTQRIAPINPDGTAYSPGADITEQSLARYEELARIARQRRIAQSTPADSVVITTLPIDTSQEDV